MVMRWGLPDNLAPEGDAGGRLNILMKHGFQLASEMPSRGKDDFGGARRLHRLLSAQHGADRHSVGEFVDSVLWRDYDGCPGVSMRHSIHRAWWH
jgi:hypothetical protein